MICYNRRLVIVLVGIWACCWVGAAVFTIFFPGTAIDTADSVVGFFGKHLGYTRLVFGIVGVVLALGGLAFLAVGWAPLRFRRGSVPLVSVSGGATKITAAAIAERIKHDVERLEEVVMAEAEVAARRDAVGVHLHLVTEFDTDPVAKSEEACRAVRERVENRIGVKLQRLLVSIDPDQRPPQA